MNVLIRGHAKYILFYKIISYKIISVIVISVYVHLDDRAYDLPTTTSVTQATSDEYATTLVQPPLQRLKSPLNTQEVIQIVKATCRRLIQARINVCHRRLNHFNIRLQQRLDKLKQLIPTNLLDVIRDIADQQAMKTTEQYRIKTELKLTRLQRIKDKKRHKTDENWVRNISSRPLDKTETQVLSYGQKHINIP